MVTYNRLEYTRLALEAMLKLDYSNLRLVVWDNASTDGTIAYLRKRIDGIEHVRAIASPTNRGVVFPMNEVWSSDPEAELLAKIDNDTLVPPDLLRRLAECHAQSQRFGVLSGFHFRKEGEALAEAPRLKTFDGVQVLPQPYVGGCAVMIRRDVFQRLGPITCRTDVPDGKPFMDSGWTFYQQRLTDAGFINGYPWPPVHVDQWKTSAHRTASAVRNTSAISAMSAVWDWRSLPMISASGDRTGRRARAIPQIVPRRTRFSPLAKLARRARHRRVSLTWQQSQKTLFGLQPGLAEF
jgi:glycosyltransferase involved in cell wall biosynthesis